MHLRPPKQVTIDQPVRSEFTSKQRHLGEFSYGINSTVGTVKLLFEVMWKNSALGILIETQIELFMPIDLVTICQIFPTPLVCEGI